MREKKGSVAAAAVWVTLLSVLLCWIPVVGQYLAGRIGTRRVEGAGRVLAAACVPAVLWVLALVWLSATPVKVGGQEVTLGQLRLVAPAMLVAIFAGALASVKSVPAWIGPLVAVGALAWTGVSLRPIVEVAKQLAPQQVAYQPEKNKTCPENLKQLYTAVSLYADSWDGVLPPADRWMTAIKDNVPNDAWLRCPDVAPASANHGYAMNPALGGKKLTEIPNRGKTPLFYDSTDLKADAHGDPSTMPKPGRHTGRNNVVYADGQVRSEAPKR